jgi:CheY-like chemotaxis protein
MDDYLAKPAGLPEIRAMLEKWLPADPDQEIESAL